MTGKKLLKRFIAVFLTALGLFVFFDAVQANAVTLQNGVGLVVSPTAYSHTIREKISPQISYARV